MFDTLEKLADGDYSFIMNLTPLDKEFLISRICKSPKYDQIVNILINSPYEQFLLKIIYDNPKYTKETINIIKKYNIKLDSALIYGFINAHNDNFEYIINNLEEYLKSDYENVLKILINYMVKNNKDFKPLKRITDMKIRAAFIQIILKNYPDLFYQIFPDFMDYLYGYNYEENEQLDLLIPIMNISDIEQIAFLILDNLDDKYLFSKILEFIINNYKSNQLAYFMLKRNNAYINNVLRINADILFNTSSSPLELLEDERFKEMLSPEVKVDFKLKYNLYLENDSSNLEHIFLGNLESDLLKWMEICLSKSQGKIVKKIGSGISAEVYRIGDYVIKLIKQKMSKAKILCPENYLVLPTLYERYITNENGDIIAGIEVQRYLETPNLETIGRLEHLFRESFKQKGYVLNDLLVRDGNPNVGLLPSYKEANCRNPENLPEWFKETPLVLMDRDLVYPVPKKRK